MKRTEFAFCIFLFTSLLVGKASAATESGLEKFLSLWEDKVINALQYIHANPSATENGRFLILDAGDQKYIQCHFHDDDTAIDCEASSGFYGPKPNTLKFSPQALAHIAKEGFSVDESVGNFSFDIPVMGDKTLRDVARHMLRTLYLAYRPFEYTPRLCSPYTPDRYVEYKRGTTPDTSHIEYASTKSDSDYQARCIFIQQKVHTVAGPLKLHGGFPSSLWLGHDKIMEAKGLVVIGSYPQGNGKPSLISFAAGCNQHDCKIPEPYLIDMASSHPAKEAFYLPIRLAYRDTATDAPELVMTAEQYGDNIFVFRGQSSEDTDAEGNWRNVTFVYDRKQEILVRQRWNNR